MISLNINTSKFDPAHYTTANGKRYAKVILRRNDSVEGVDAYGNHWMITQGVSLEAKKAGQQGPILGNGKNIRQEHNTPLIVIDLCLDKIKKERLYKGKTGFLLSCHLHHPTQKDDVEADYIVRQDVTQEERLEAKRGDVIGYGHKKDFTRTGGGNAPARSAPPADAPPKEPGDYEQATGTEDDIPF